MCQHGVTLEGRLYNRLGGRDHLFVQYSWGRKTGVVYIEHSGSLRPQKFEETHTKFSLPVKFCLEAVHSKAPLPPMFGNGWFVLELYKLPVEQGNSSPALAISAPALFTFFFSPPVMSPTPTGG